MSNKQSQNVSKGTRQSNFFLFTIFNVLSFFIEQVEDDFCCKVYNLQPTDDREAGEEAHGAAHSSQHVCKLDAAVLSDHVEDDGVEVDPDELKVRLVFLVV